MGYSFLMHLIWKIATYNALSHNRLFIYFGLRGTVKFYEKICSHSFTWTACVHNVVNVVIVSPLHMCSVFVFCNHVFCPCVCIYRKAYSITVHALNISHYICVEADIRHHSTVKPQVKWKLWKTVAITLWLFVLKKERESVHLNSKEKVVSYSTIVMTIIRVFKLKCSYTMRAKKQVFFTETPNYLRTCV